MTKAGKALVVFVTVMSLAFLAFIGVTTLGGPNWQRRAEALSGYTIESTGGETPQWRVIARVSDPPRDLGVRANLPAAITLAQNDRLQVQQQRLTTLDEEIQRLQTTLADERQASEQDVQGIETRLARLNAQAEQLDQLVVDLTRQVTQQAQQAETVRAQAGARAADVARLQTELAQVRADRYRINTQIAQLEQRLIRLGGQLDRASRRHQQLRAGTNDYEASARP